MTVDWSNWMQLSDAQQKALWARYRAIVKQESDDSRFSNYERMNAAIRFPYHWRQFFPEERHRGRR
jgi:predicted Fe-S protein YdhL (DUF1289 family)